MSKDLAALPRLDLADCRRSQQSQSFPRYLSGLRRLSRFPRNRMISANFGRQGLLVLCAFARTNAVAQEASPSPAPLDCDGGDDCAHSRAGESAFQMNRHRGLKIVGAFCRLFALLAVRDISNESATPRKKQWVRLPLRDMELKRRLACTGERNLRYLRVSRKVRG